MNNFKALKFTVVALGLLVLGLPVFAHHSFAAEFDGTRVLHLEGVITEVDWVNPHSWWHVDVTNAKGVVEHWNIQSDSPIQLRRAGMTRVNFGKPGDKVKIIAYPAKDGTRDLAIIQTITFEESGLTFKLLDDFTR
jgi:Family of unknown function (DUF6152)